MGYVIIYLKDAPAFTDYSHDVSAVYLMFCTVPFKEPLGYVLSVPTRLTALPIAVHSTRKNDCHIKYISLT